MTGEVRIEVPISQLKTWATELEGISEPMVSYDEKMENMKTDIITASREIADTVRGQICDVLDE